MLSLKPAEHVHSYFQSLMVLCILLIEERFVQVPAHCSMAAKGPRPQPVSVWFPPMGDSNAGGLLGRWSQLGEE